MERDNKGRFVKGNTEGHRFTRNGDAAEAARKATEAREKNRAIAEVVRAELAKMAPGAGCTKMEYLAIKAINTHANGQITFKDLHDLQKVLGEDVQRIDFGENPINITFQDKAAMEGLKAALAVGAMPRKPKDESEEG